MNNAVHHSGAGPIVARQSLQRGGEKFAESAAALIGI
jgi:hypothetical protein